ncbi:MAG: hypothetical protein FGM33_08085 [Candidatus Kapabacteria bacterium]|nr:hypothetical protein [Candidatus Kapabacteria bacterium]
MNHAKPLALAAWFFLLMFMSAHEAAAQDYPPVIRSIRIDRRDVFDQRDRDWFFGSSILNGLHTLTKEYVIEDEIFFDIGDDLDTVGLLETERVLRLTGVFSSVRVRHERVGDSADVVIETQDRWSLDPAVVIATGGGISTLGGQIEEFNILGTASRAKLLGINRTENDIGMQGTAELSLRRFLRTPLWAELAVTANRFRTDQDLTLTMPYWRFFTPWAFSARFTNAFGSDFAYDNAQTSPRLLPFRERTFDGWISQADGEKDRIFVTAALRASDIRRVDPTSRQAFDNTAHFLVGFSSISQNFTTTRFLNGYETEDLQQGAWGSAILGRVFSMGQGSTPMWYIAGQAEQSQLITPSLYAFAHISAGTGFIGASARNTSVDVHAIAHWRVDQNFVLTSRLRSQTVWNWNGFHQLVLDPESGMRSLDANALTGDSRFVMNTELRWFPRWQLWIFGFSAVAFHDLGTVFDQSAAFLSSRYRNAIGAGIRIHNLKSASSDATFRFDVAYDPLTGRLSGLIFAVNQMFSAFGQHQFRPPTIIGRQIDGQ